MSAKLRISSLCFSLVTLCALTPARASVAYVVNCCQHSSTVSVFATSSNRQTAQWKVGAGAFAAVFSPDGSTAYVSNEGSQSVTVVEVASGATVATIPVGYAIEWMVISKDGGKLYAQSYDYAYESHVVSIDTATNTVSQVLGIAAYLSPMALTPDGATLYAYSSMGNPPGLLVIDTSTLTVTTTVPINGVAVAVTPDGKFAYVLDFASIAVMDTATNAVVATIPLDPSLSGTFIQISPDGSMAWVSESPHAGHVSPAITVIQTATNQVTGSMGLLRKATPGAIVFSPDGKRAWVTADGAAVDVMDAVGLKAVSEIDSLGSVYGPAISPDGTVLLLPNTGTSRAAAFSQSGTELASIPLGDMDGGNQIYIEYGGAAVSPDGARVYVTNYYSNNVSVIDTAFKKVFASVETGRSPVGVAVAPNGSKAYVANSFSNSVTVIDTKTFATRQIPMPESSYPSSIAISPDGARVYVAGDNLIPDFGNARCYIFVIDASSDRVVDSIRIPYPMAVTVSPDGTKVYVVGGLTNLYTISTATDTITSSVQLANGGPEQPITSGIAVTPDGATVFADNGFDNQVFEIDVAQNQLVKTITVGAYPGILAITPDGSQVWAGDYYAKHVSIIDVQSGSVTGTIPLDNQSYGIAFGPR